MIEKMKASRDNKQFCAAILTDLSKAFDCICYDLLVAKLNTYGFDKKALRLIYGYLNGRSHKIKVGSSFSSKLDISYGAPQGSILGSLLFNIDICDLFFVNITSVVANYADVTTPYECDQNCDNLISNMELTVEKIFNFQTAFDELILRCYVKGVPHKIHYCYKQFLRLYIEFSQFLSNLAYDKTSKLLMHN